MSDDNTTTASTDLVIAGDQRNFTPIQVAALESMGIADASEGDQALFFHQAKRTGLDPFAKQIYMIGRWTKVKSKDDRGRNVERYAMAYTIQVGIEGYRLIAERAAVACRDRVEFEGPFWCGEDMEWHDAWPKSKGTPEAAKYVVVKNGQRVSAVCHFDEYVQTYFDRDAGVHVPNSMWSKMPRNQIAKCAEAAALRRAYPNDFSGVHLEDAATIIDQDGNVEHEPSPAKQPPQRARGTGGLRDAAAAATSAPQPDESEPVDAEVVPDVPEPAAAEEAPPAFDRRKGLNRMHQLFTEGDLPKDARDDRLIVTSKIVDRTIASSNDLTDDEIGAVNHKLAGWSNTGKLAAEITEILNQATIDEINAAESESAEDVGGDAAAEEESSAADAAADS